jgi:hypothetical protein
MTDVMSYEEINSFVNEYKVENENRDFSLFYKLFQLGNITYDSQIVECRNTLDFKSIRKEIISKYSIIENLTDEDMFPSDTHPKYYGDQIRRKVLEIYNDNSKFDEVWSWFKNYWIQKRILFTKIEEKYENLVERIVHKFSILENDPEMNQIMDTFHDIKDDFISEGINFFKAKQITNFLDKKQLEKELEENFPILFTKVCNRRGITDKDLIDKMIQMNGVSKSMIQISLSVKYFGDAVKK